MKKTCSISPGSSRRQLSPARTVFSSASARLALLLASGAGLSTASAQIAAFPGAEGAGAYAKGGRGGDVYHLTNTNASGVGGPTPTPLLALRSPSPERPTLLGRAHRPHPRAPPRRQRAVSASRYRRVPSRTDK